MYDAVRYTAGFVAEPATYYEHFRPATPTGKPTLVMVPGGAHTGACYLATPDGRPGWAFDFLRRRFPVVTLDWPGTGRSGHTADAEPTGTVVCAGIAKVIAAIGGPVVLMVHSMSGAYGWKLIETCGDDIAALIAIAPAPPGNLQAPPEILRETATRFEIHGTTNYVVEKSAPFVADLEYVERKLAGDGTRFPRENLAAYAATLVALPGSLLRERLNIGDAQLKVGDFAAYRSKPILIVTGTHDIDHPKAFDAKIAQWAAAAGAAVEFRYLGDHGIAGNGHMMMLERNSAEIAASIGDWIEKEVERVKGIEPSS